MKFWIIAKSLDAVTTYIMLTKCSGIIEGNWVASNIINLGWIYFFLFAILITTILYVIYSYLSFLKPIRWFAFIILIASYLVVFNNIYLILTSNCHI